MAKIVYNKTTKLFSIRLFSEITSSEIEEFRKLELDSLVPYKITTNESKRPRFANDIIAFLQYGSRKDHDVHLTIHPDSRKYGNFKDLDLSDFQFIRKILVDKSGSEVRLQYRDNDMLASFFSMVIEGKPELRLMEIPVKLAKDTQKYDFYKLIDVFNKFTRDFESFRFYTIRNVFPLREVYEYYTPRVPKCEFEISISKDRIMISALNGTNLIVSVTFNKDKTLNLSIDEGELQRRIPRDVYELMIDKIMKTKNLGFNTVKVELINATNIYTSLTTMFKRLKMDEESNTFNTY